MLKNAKFAAFFTFKMNSKLVNVSKLLSANVIAQAVGLLIYPLLTRLYQPADFTLLNLFLTIANAILIFSTADLQFAIPLPKKDDGAYALIGAMVVSLSITISLSLISCLFCNRIAAFFGIAELEWALWYLPIYIPIAGAWQVLTYLFNREKKYGKIATYQIIQSIANSILKLAFGILGIGGLALIDASVIGPLIACACVAPLKILEVVSHLRRLPTNLAKEYVLAYKDFPLYSMPKNLVCHLSNGLPVLMLTSVYGATEVGYFALAITIGYLPLTMIASSIYQVMLKSTSDKLNEGLPIYPGISKFCKYALLIIFVTFGILYIFLPSITEFLFGPGWCKTGEILRILLLWFSAGFLSTTLVFVPETLLKLKGNLIIELVFIIVRIAALSYGIVNFGFLVTIKLFSLVSFGIKAFQVGWYLWIAKQNDKSLEKN